MTGVSSSRAVVEEEDEEEEDEEGDEGVGLEMERETQLPRTGRAMTRDPDPVSQGPGMSDRGYQYGNTGHNDYYGRPSGPMSRHGARYGAYDDQQYGVRSRSAGRYR